MNLSLSREVYGMNPWCVDQVSFPALLNILSSIKNGVALDVPETKYNSASILDLRSKEVRTIDRPYGNDWYKGQLDNSDDFLGVGIINIDGVITVSGGASSHGMEYLSDQMQAMSKDARIGSFIVVGNSGGGSSMAVEIMSDTINEIDKIKPVYGLVKKGGMMASACFGIMSACRKIYAESEMSTVGSSGTMMQFSGRPANSEGDDGVKHIRLYAPESDHKNKGFEDAVNKDDYKVIVDQMLKPVNDRFLALIESNRPQIVGSTFRNGHTTFAKDAIGTFIDGIKSFAEVVSIATGETVEGVSLDGKESENSIENKNLNTNTNLNNDKMTKAEIKAAHPSAYAEIVAEGVTQERDRSGAWMAHVKTDPDAVKAGIESGNQISSTEREQFFVKQNSQSTLEKMKAGNAPDGTQPESKTAEELAKEANQKAVAEAFDFKLD